MTRLDGEICYSFHSYRIHPFLATALLCYSLRLIVHQKLRIVVAFSTKQRGLYVYNPLRALVNTEKTDLRSPLSGDISSIMVNNEPGSF